MFKFVVVLAACAAVRAVEYGHEGGYGGHGGHDDYYTEPHYSFSYEVKDSHTGDYKSHHEERKGDHTQGVYSLVEPDGSKRTVEYLVEGKSGLIAKVHRDGSSYSNGYGDHQSYDKPSYNSGYKPSYDKPSYNSGYKPSYKPSYSQSYHQPSYKPSYHQPSYHHEEPSYHQPSYNKPSYHQPSYHHEEPSYHQPSYNKPSYHQPSYHHEEPSYSKPSYGHGHASSSVKISTHGAKIATTTNHHAPAKYAY